MTRGVCVIRARLVALLTPLVRSAGGEPLRFLAPALVLLSLMVAPVGAETPYRFVTEWGEFGGGPGQFDRPIGLAVDLEGNVYATDWGNHRVQKFTRDGTFIRQWGSEGRGESRFLGASGIAVDRAGDVYVVDSHAGRIQKFTTGGTFLAQWAAYCYPVFVDPPHPVDVAVDGGGAMFTPDCAALFPEDKVYKFTNEGICQIDWYDLSLAWRLSCPNGVAVNREGHVYIADSGNHRVLGLGSEGVPIAVWGTHGTGDGQFDRPWRLAFDGDGSLYVTDFGNHRVQKFDANGRYLTQWGRPGNGTAEFNGPAGVAVGPDGRVYVADSGNHRIEVFAPTDPTPVVRTTWGRLKTLYR